MLGYGRTRISTSALVYSVLRHLAGPLVRRVLLIAALFSAVAVPRSEEPTPSSPPPADSSAAQIDWEKEQTFWAFQRPVAHSVPAVGLKSWPRQRIDRFILSELEAHGIEPSPEADARVLLRRATLDITGLPPTQAEVVAFCADKSLDRYEQLVDRLLSSSRFGERLASLWLPLARYAEDQAHQVGDDTKYFYPNAFRYREWVINAFNSNLPFDRFLRLQLAADKFEGLASQNLAALGFLGLGPKYYNRDRLDVQADEWEDSVDTVCRTVLGLTVACARCHDHKFDPLTMSDYYALAGVFASTRLVNKTLDGQTAKEDTQAGKLPPSSLHIVEDTDKPQDLPIFLRGNVDRKGPVVARRFPTILTSPDAPPLKGGFGRKELAEALASSQNPLTARVFANRIWGQFFGKPLAAAPSNFGHSGSRPTHPELLDDLAHRFMANGWDVKALIRELVLSSTYRQASIGSPSSVRKDPSNQWFGRMSRRRLSVEQWRDSVLAYTGELDQSGGKSSELDDPKNLRRTVYARVSRLKLNDVLMQFDYPDANVHAEKRNTTTTAVQKLFVLNSAFMLERAKVLALAITKGLPSTQDAERVGGIYSLVMGRAPRASEKRLALDFLAKPQVGDMPRWEQYAQALLASNELFYLD